MLDEPLSALDPFLRIRMRTELKRLQRELGISFIHVTHGQDEAMALADMIVLMNGGRISQVGTPRDIFNQPADEFVARFMGGHNIIRQGARAIAVRGDHLKLLPKKAKAATTKHFRHDFRRRVSGQFLRRHSQDGTRARTSSCR